MAFVFLWKIRNFLWDQSPTSESSSGPTPVPLGHFSRREVRGRCVCAGCHGRSARCLITRLSAAEARRVGDESSESGRMKLSLTAETIMASTFLTSLLGGTSSLVSSNLLYTFNKSIFPTLSFSSLLSLHVSSLRGNLTLCTNQHVETRIIDLHCLFLEDCLMIWV